MPINQRVTFNVFVNAFDLSNRGSAFSRPALEWLFYYYSHFDNYELDVIGICSEWGEYTKEQLLKYFGKRIDIEDVEDIENITTEIDYLGYTVVYLARSDSFLLRE
jgi:hypothetical protein